MTSQSLRDCVFTACVASLAAGCSMNSGTIPAPVSAAVSQVRHTGAMPETTLSYYGGPVLTTPKMYIIFWGFKQYGDPDNVAKLLRSYCRAIGGSAHDNIYTQYYETIGGLTIYITNPRNQCGGWWYDEKDQVPVNPTDAQVAAEAQAGVQHFGYDAGGSYVVATPHAHNSAGFGTQFCAYHSASYTTGKLVSYTNLPYMPDAGSNSCGNNALYPPPKDELGIDEGVTIIEGREYGASITDPSPGSGWYNQDFGEISDICSFQFQGTQELANDRFRDKRYTTQAMFSNATQSCVQGYK